MGPRSRSWSWGGGGGAEGGGGAGGEEGRGWGVGGGGGGAGGGGGLGEVEVHFAAEVGEMGADLSAEVGGGEPLDGGEVDALGLGGGEESSVDQGIKLVGEV